MLTVQPSSDRENLQNTRTRFNKKHRDLVLTWLNIQKTCILAPLVERIKNRVDNGVFNAFLISFLGHCHDVAGLINQQVMLTHP